MRCSVLALLTALSLVGCASGGVTQTELEMASHPHAGEQPAMYLERAGRLLVYEGEIDQIEMLEQANEEGGGTGTGGNLNSGSLTLSSYTLEGKLRLKLFDPARIGPLFEERLPEGLAPEEVEVRAILPDESARLLAATVNDRTLGIPLTGLPNGTVIIIKYAIRDADLYEIPTFEVQGSLPVLAASFRIRAAEYREVAFQTLQRDGIRLGVPRERRTRDPHGVKARWIIWEVEELPAATDDQPRAAVLVTQIPPPPRNLGLGAPGFGSSN